MENFKDGEVLTNSFLRESNLKMAPKDFFQKNVNLKNQCATFAERFCRFKRKNKKISLFKI